MNDQNVDDEYEIDELIVYANSLLKDISKVYKCVTYYFNELLEFDISILY